MIASKDDLTPSRCEQLDWLLARHSLVRVPFFGGFKVFSTETISDENWQHVGSYCCSWPYVSVYLFEDRVQRVGTFWKRGIVVQGRAPWHARSGVQTQFFYDEENVFPTSLYRFGEIEQPLPLPRFATRVLAQDYGEQCFSDVLPPKRLCRENEVATHFAQEPTPIQLVRALYATFGWKFGW